VADQWGPIQIPLAAGLEGDAVGDPALSTLLAFLKAYLVDDKAAEAEWNRIGVAPNQPCVKTTQVWNPSDAHGDHRGVSFNTADLPGLFAFREESKQEWISEDIVRDTAQVKIFWVFPIAVQGTQRVRQSFGNALVKLITVAIERGRTPSWKVAGDPDDRAADEGSLVYTFLNATAFYLTKWRPTRVVVEGDTQKQSYAAIEITIEWLEDLEQGLDRFPEATSIRVTQTNEQGDVTNDALFEDPDPSGNEGD
jgi:hypothetical protein